MSTQTEVAANERYCPFCGRWLATLRDDGSFDLAGRASVDLVARVPFLRADGTEIPLRFKPSYEAHCLRWRCRLRARLRRPGGLVPSPDTPPPHHP